MSILAKSVRREIRGENPQSCFITGDAVATLTALKESYEGKAALVYMDPPFGTGKSFTLRCPVGAEEWKNGRSSAAFTAYDDKMERSEYLDYMRSVLEGCKTLLKPGGLMFLHIDFRYDAYLRLLLDEVFGENCFINEIVWAYESGGRAKNYFSRKHDIILLYSSGPKYELDTMEVARVIPGGRDNHMRREIDEDGRTYRSIKSAGKIYRYYDDEPVPPSDVWTDISHIQQRDPQRMGFDTQKPLELLERILKCASKPGDLIIDPFAGSCTTLEAALKLGRRCIAIDKNPRCARYARRRSNGYACIFESPCTEASPLCEASAEDVLAYCHVTLERFTLEDGAVDFEIKGLDSVDSWAAGYMEGDTFISLVVSERSPKSPEIKRELDVPFTQKALMFRITDILGRDFYFYP